MTPEEYARHDGIALATLIRRGEVTPAEVLDAALACIDARNPELNAVVVDLRERARAQLAAELPDGPFRGVPMLLKDSLAHLRGVPTSEGTRLLTQRPRPHDSELTRRLARAGFVFAGKTNLPELGILGITEGKLFGTAKNPWDAQRTPGGSSGGSAVAVAARMVPIAHGSDGGGSIRIPAACCGVFGLKPSRGRTPMGPDLDEHWGGMTAQHVLTRSVRDSAAVLDAVAGPDVGAPYALPRPDKPFLAQITRPPPSLRIAFCTDALWGGQTHPDCRAAVEDVARVCQEMGHEVSEARPSFDRDRMVRGYLMRVAAETAATVEWIGKIIGKQPEPSDFEDITWGLCVIGRNVSAGRLTEVEHELGRQARSVASFFERYDVLMTPTLAQPATPVGALMPNRLEMAGLKVLKRVQSSRVARLTLRRFEHQNAMLDATSNTMLFNVTGQPAASLPIGWPADGAPIGVQIAGRLGSDATLLQLAAQLEDARPWADRAPF